VIRFLLAAAIAAAACAGAAQFGSSDSGDRLGAWIPDPRFTLLHTESSQLDNPTLAVVSDLPSWSALWAQAWGGAQDAPPLPQIDFVVSSVVVVGLGKRAGLGYAVTIDSIVVHVVGSVLFATESQPRTSCNPGSGFSRPVHMVLAPEHFPVTEWRMETIRRDCASSAPPP
jgi:hypothetical protein